MSETGECSCSLQARLHQVENARSREMKAHGELVQQLERELESRRISEAEVRLTAAKLRTGNCRLEAELCVANATVRQQLEQLDALRTESGKREGEFQTACNENERRLQDSRAKSEQLLEEKRQLNVKLSECRTLLENALGDKEVLLAKNEELCFKASTQTVEIEKLSAAVVSKQQEIEASAARSQVLIDDLASTRGQQKLMQGRFQEVEHEINRTLLTRNRALHWRLKRNQIRDNQFLSYGVFLTWKSVSVEARLRSAAKIAQCNEHNHGRLQLVEQEVLKRCSQAQYDLQSFRQACAGERTQIQSLRDEVCQVELPKLRTQLETLHKDFASQREGFESQLESQRVSLENYRTQLDMSRQEIERRLHKSKLDIAQLAHQKRQKLAVFQVLTTQRQRESQYRTFSAWKEFYLRSIVGQATHAAMVFSSHQPPVNTTNILSPSDDSGSWAITAAIQTTSVAIRPLQLGKLDRRDSLRSPMSEAATPVDAMWRKWRRVDAGMESKGQKLRPSKS